MTEQSPPEWIGSDDWMIFISDRPFIPGEAEQHGMKDWWSNLRAKNIEEGKAEFLRVFKQIDQIIGGLPRSFQGFESEEFEIGLAFTAEGQLAFIAKAGLEASIKVTFKRKAA